MRGLALRRFITVLSVPLLLVLAAALTFFLQPLWVNDQVIRFHLWRAHVQSHYIQVDGYQVHYFEASPPPLPAPHPPEKVLVLVHGLGSRGEDWSAMIPTLAANGFHVFVPDLLGYGRSTKPDITYTISQQERLVADFMHQLSLQHVDLGGWSMGGWVALKLTADQPALVDRLVLFDSAGVYFPPTFEASLFTPTDSVGLARLSSMLSPQPHPLPSYVSRAAVRKLQANAWVIDRSVTSMEAGKDLMDFRLHQITQPTLIVWGKLDQLIPLSVGEFMHRRIPGSSLVVVDGCGHLAPGECAHPVLQATVSFLNSSPPIRELELSLQGVSH